MKTRSVLLYVPAVPFRLETLLPQRELALTASALLDQGHATEVWDYGVLDELVRARECLRSQARTLRFWRPPASNQYSLLRQDDILQRLRDFGLPDFVLILVQARGDLPEAAALSHRLREAFPQLRQVVSGDYIRRFAQFIVLHGAWDAVSVSGAPVGIADFAATCHAPERWRTLDGIASRYLTGSRPSRLKRPMPPPSPLPEYDPRIYTAMHPAQKFHILTVSTARQAPAANYGPSVTGPSFSQGSTRQLQEEVRWLQQQWSASVFRLQGLLGQREIEQIAPRRSGPLMANYSVEVAVEELAAGTADTLRETGCLLVHAPLDTGSQRLLDEFYGRQFGVSHAEAVLRPIRAAGMFLHGGFQFPCAMDDYHTRAETVRIAKRCGVCAATITAPEVYPGSLWRQRPEDFGFLLHPRKYSAWCRATAGKQDTIYRMQGWGSGGAERERGRLLAELEEAGVWPIDCAQAPLLARVTGHAGQERTYAQVLHRRLQELDVDALYAMIRDFNERAAFSAKPATYPQFAEVRAAVGN